MKSACRILVVCFLLSLAIVLASCHARLSLHERLQGQRQDAMEKDFSPLVGMEKEEAKRWVTEKYPELKVHVLVEGSMVTRDYRTDRLRIFHNNAGVVTVAPRVG
eukprot:TRINITY_DN84_c0_g1_i1.p2 TRINITY_DN84_c0_g1~~TRINITY_DN84_c0_g1_i1.p2  ORF type:complete len:105 (+),score=14.03 TRINITY_DN84_c0_g1_i1:84-398(+)